VQCLWQILNRNLDLNGTEKELHLTTFFEGGFSNRWLKLAEINEQPQWKSNEEWWWFELWGCRPLRLRIGFCGGGVIDSFNERCGNLYSMSLRNCLIYLKAMPLVIVIMSSMLTLWVVIVLWRSIEHDFPKWRKT
jgi:hypothetical protein